MNTTKAMLPSLDVSTRGKRRKAVALIVDMLGKIHDAEYDYMERMPQNLRSSPAYDAAEYSLDFLVEAINDLADAYYY